MYHIPEEFFTKKNQYIHVAPGQEEIIYHALLDTDHRIYYEFVNFCKRWNNKDNYVLCFFDQAEKTVHINGNATPDAKYTIYELEDLIEHETDLHEILQLL